MTVQKSVAVRNAALDAEETAIGASPILRFRTGAVPANCAAADSGSVLVSMSLPADPLANASAGAKALTGTWSGTSSGTGIGQHWRMYDAAGTTCHYQGLLSEAYANSKTYAVGQTVHNVNGVYRCTTTGASASSGTGPSGTGTGIVDGAAQFSYIQAAPDMTIDNTSINSGQTMTVTGFTQTAASA